MKIVKTCGLLLLAGALIIVSMWVYSIAPRMESSIPAAVVTNFTECAQAGNPIMESYPRQCRTSDGRLFVEDVPPPALPDGGMVFNGCAIAGCSGQLCVSADEAADIVTTCEYRAEYMCYKEAVCEPQANGTCGWTQDARLHQCLTNPPELQKTIEFEVQ